MPSFFYRELAWAFLIIIGGIMITPEGPIPISIKYALGIASIAIGVAGFIAGRGKAVGN